MIEITVVILEELINGILFLLQQLDILSHLVIDGVVLMVPLDSVLTLLRECEGSYDTEKDDSLEHDGVQTEDDIQVTATGEHKPVEEVAQQTGRPFTTSQESGTHPHSASLILTEDFHHKNFRYGLYFIEYYYQTIICMRDLNMKLFFLLTYFFRCLSLGPCYY